MKLRSDLPIKYYFNLHNEIEIYDDFSVLFNIIQYLIKVIQIKNKKETIDSFKFSSKSLKYIFGDKLNDETFKHDLVKRIKTLISLEFISVKDDTMCITKKGLTYFYIIE